MVKVKLFRFDPTKDNKPRYEEYQVPMIPDMSVLGVLNYIYEELDSSIAYYSSCRFGRCGGCTVIVNGKARLACLTAASEEMTVEPLQGYMVIRDLIVDLDKSIKKSDSSR
jgi:succinate dehydrogenase/fumarate reductase iron-sulfur protein